MCTFFRLYFSDPACAIALLYSVVVNKFTLNPVTAVRMWIAPNGSSKFLTFRQGSFMALSHLFPPNFHRQSL